MSPGVRLRNGVEISLADGTTVVCDGNAPADVTVCTHAHTDHLVSGPDAVASELTAALANARRPRTSLTAADHTAIELVPAGHVAGSRAARITDPETGRRYLYTGDVSTRDRFFLEGFEPVDADVLIVEATYGEPAYSLPPTDAVVADIHDWLAETMDTVAVLFGYALGRAQTLQSILADSVRDRVFVTDGIADVNETIEAGGVASFERSQRLADGGTGLSAGDAVVAPSARSTGVADLIEAHDAATAGVSGWAVEDSYVYRRGVDRGFALSDHCDFGELLDLVEAVDPERVYTQHGSTETLARQLTARGFDAVALKRDQSTLSEF